MDEQQIVALIEAIARKHYVTPARIIGPERNRYVHAARKDVAITLSKAGFNSTQIGQVLKRHPTTVLEMLGRIGARSKAA